MKIQVEAYSGYKANERPIKLWIGEKAVFVESIEEQWRGVDAYYFRVNTDDGKSHIVRHNESTDEWTVERSSGSPA